MGKRVNLLVKWKIRVIIISKQKSKHLIWLKKLFSLDVHDCNVQRNDRSVVLGLKVVSVMTALTAACCVSPHSWTKGDMSVY